MAEDTFDSHYNLTEEQEEYITNVLCEACLVGETCVGWEFTPYCSMEQKREELLKSYSNYMNDGK